MKNLKLLFLALFSLIIISCNDDNDVKETKTLRYSKTEIKDFLLWEGSETGAKSVSTESENPKSLFQNYNEYEKNENNLKQTTITFLNDTLVNFGINGKDSIFKYFFLDNALHYYENKEYKDREPYEVSIFGYGNHEKITIDMGLIKWHKNSQIKGCFFTQLYHFNLENGLNLMSVESLQELTSTTDTIAIYNATITLK